MSGDSAEADDWRVMLRRRRRLQIGKLWGDPTVMFELEKAVGCISRSGVRRYQHEYDNDGVCLWCDQVRDESKWGDRTVALGERDGAESRSAETSRAMRAARCRWNARR